MELRIEYMPLGKLPAAKRNPKQHDVETIRASIVRLGFNDPVAINERTGRLVEGAGRLKALRSLKRANEPAPERVRVKGKMWLLPVLRGVDFETDEEAEAYLLAHNQLTIGPGWDDSGVARIIADIEREQGDLVGVLGFGDFEPPQLPALDDSPPDNTGTAPRRIAFSPEQWSELQRLTQKASGKHPRMSAERVLASLRQ